MRRDVVTFSIFSHMFNLLGRSCRDARAKDFGLQRGHEVLVQKLPTLLPTFWFWLFANKCPVHSPHACGDIVGCCCGHNCPGDNPLQPPNRDHPHILPPLPALFTLRLRRLAVMGASLLCGAKAHMARPIACAGMLASDFWVSTFHAMWLKRCVEVPEADS